MVNILSDGNVTTLLVFIATFVLVYWITSRPSDVPRGPLRLPLLGNILSLIGSDTQHILENLRKEYGDVYGLYIGSDLNVFLNGYDAISDALLKKGSAFAFRPKTLVGDPEIVFANGITWKKNRDFVMQAFRDLCFVNKGENLEKAISEELECFSELLDSMDGAFYPQSHMSSSFANVMFTICHGYRAGYDSEKFQWYLAHVEESIRIFAKTQIVNKCFPFLRYLPGDFNKTNLIKSNMKVLQSYFDEMCQTNYQEYEEGERTCLTNILLEHDSPVPKERIWTVLHEMMAAGSETTATTMSWFFLLAGMYPEVQSKLHENILSTIGNNMPSLSDRGSMPYVEATMLECLRFGSVVPLALPHTVHMDIRFRGYIIPNGATVLPNLASINMDPNRFKEPKVFKPERFLSADGKSVVGADSIIPFSLGQRACLGETIARIELFMYIVFLVQKYEIELSAKPAAMFGVLGLTNKPQPYKITLTKRTVKQ